MPRRIQRWAGLPVALALFLLLREARLGVERNLERIAPGGRSPWVVRRLAFRTFRHYGQYLLDYMVLPYLGGEGLRSIIERIGTSLAVP